MSTQRRRRVRRGTPVGQGQPLGASDGSYAVRPVLLACRAELSFAAAVPRGSGVLRYAPNALFAADRDCFAGLYLRRAAGAEMLVRASSSETAEGSGGQPASRVKMRAPTGSSAFSQSPSPRRRGKLLGLRKTRPQPPDKDAACSPATRKHPWRRLRRGTSQRRLETGPASHKAARHSPQPDAAKAPMDATAAALPVLVQGKGQEENAERAAARVAPRRLPRGRRAHVGDELEGRNQCRGRLRRRAARVTREGYLQNIARRDDARRSRLRRMRRTRKASNATATTTTCSWMLRRCSKRNR